MIGVHTVATVSTAGKSAGRNYVTDPRVVNASGWSSVAPGGALTYTDGYGLNIPATAGQVWTVSAYFTAPPDRDLTGQFRVGPCTDELFGTNPSAPTPFTVPAGQTLRVTNTYAIPAGANGLRVAWAALSVYDGSAKIGRVMAEKSASFAGPYFDGDTLDTDLFHYGWSGTANASESIRNSYFGADLSCLVDTVSINHGRDDTTSQPEASSATINLTTTADDPLPLEVDVGVTVSITTTTAEGPSTRFSGKITDITLSWEEAGEDTPDHGVGQIIATGTIADIGRRVVGDEPFPAELDGARVSRVMALAGVTLDPLYSDPGVATLLPRDIDSRAALEVAHAAAASALGVLWTDRAGNVRYADAQHRRGIPVGLSLDSCDILVTPQWRRTTEGLTNKVSIGYGVAPEDEEGGGGEQPRYIAERPDSIAKWGTFDYSSTTELADAGAAQRMGEIVLARNSEPVWIMSELPVDVPSLDPARYEALLDLDMHSLISLTGLPSLGHAPTQATLWVEGYTETLAYGTHDITLTVSGYCRTTPPSRWDDVAGWAWDATPPTLQWDQTACLGPSASRDRWNDQPSTLRWDQLGDTSWDAYTTEGA